MELEEHIQRAEETTAALQAALAAGDEAACPALLAARGRALAALAEASAADPRGRAALRTRLDGLVEADRQLQTAAANALADAGAAFQAGFGHGTRVHPAREAGAQPSSLDRHA